MANDDTPVWFITGCSTGFGRELAKAVLARGWRVVATARRPEQLDDLLAGHGERALKIRLDVTDHAEVVASVKEAEARFGRIDVLVNNAGYGYLAAVEEGEDAAIRAQFDANVFGLFAMTRAVLPIMRRQRSGHVINITSLAGFIVSSALVGLFITSISFFAMQEARRLRPHHAARFMGLLTALYGIGQIAGPPLTAALLARLPSRAEGFGWSLGIASAALAAGACLYVVMYVVWPRRTARA